MSNDIHTEVIVCMLQAQSNSGELMSLVSLTEAEIKAYKTNYQFYCPACKERVMIKAGRKTIPHFAHYPKSNCPEARGGEGHYHERGKLLLYQWLQSQHLDVKLEPYLREIKQQPDLLLVVNGKRIAVEYQCARISLRHIQQRSEGYKQAGIIPIWIVGANQFNRQGKFHLKIDQFTSQFIHQFSPKSPKRLLYFCPETIQLIIFQDIYLTRKRQAIGNFQFKKLYDITFTDLFTNNYLLKKDLYQLWKKEKRKFRLNNSKRLYGQDLAWRQWLYLHQTHPEHLPSLIHLPVSSQHLMKTPPWDWQSRLYMGIIDPISLGHQIQLRQVMGILQNHFYKHSHFPLIASNECPIHQYFHLLEQLEMIKKQSQNQYIKIKTAPFHKHIEAALIGDDLLMDELILKLGNKKRA